MKNLVTLLTIFTIAQVVQAKTSVEKSYVCDNKEMSKLDTIKYLVKNEGKFCIEMRKVQLGEKGNITKIKQN